MKTQREKLNDMLDQLEEKLSECSAAAKKFELAARAAGYDQPAALCGAYLGGYLESVCDHKAINSVTSLRSALDEWEEIR